MLNSSRVSATFSVHVTTHEGESVCVVGSPPELGCWLPQKAAILKRQHSSEKEVWSRRIDVPSDKHLEYRYFVCRIREAENEGEDRDVMVLQWETNLKPRKLEFNCSSSDLDEDGVATFGDYGGIKSVDRGWIHQETEIHLRLHSTPLRMWKTKYKQRQYRIKCTPLDLMHRDISFQEDDESSHDVINQGSVYNKICVYNLGGSSEDAKCKEQPQFGTPYSDDINSYMVFKCRTWEPDYLGYMFDLYFDDDGAGSYHQHVGSAHLLPVNLKESSAFRSLPINRNDRPIGEITVDYLIVKPLKELKCDMQYSYARHWRKEKSLDVGHRGMGSSHTTKTKCAAIRENTVASLQEAYDHGADFVEFDVQLSRDEVPVVYHDYTVCMSLKKKSTGGHDWFEMPVQELSLEHLQSLHLDHISEKKKGTSPDHSTVDTVPVKAHLFPTLQECFEEVSPDLGFLIEIKYCMPLQNGRLEDNLPHYTERNRYVDRVLQSVLQSAGNRKIILCSFDPDVCVMLRVKQNRYPVMFICMESTNIDSDYWDRRTRTLPISTNFAYSQHLLGMSVQVASLHKQPNAVRSGKDLGLVMFGWVDHDIEQCDEISEIKNMGLAGVIYDRISEVKPKDNIFHVNRSVRNEILSSQNMTTEKSSAQKSNWNFPTTGTDVNHMEPPGDKNGSNSREDTRGDRSEKDSHNMMTMCGIEVS